MEIQQKEYRFHEVRKQMEKVFPDLFQDQGFVPLSIGFTNDVLVLQKTNPILKKISSTKIRKFIRQWTRQPGYHEAIACSGIYGSRFGPMMSENETKPTYVVQKGFVTLPEIVYAIETLKEIHKRREKKALAAGKTQPDPIISKFCSDGKIHFLPQFVA